jgi:hypothetical protein
MFIYEILPALDLTQSIHAKIPIGMHWGDIDISLPLTVYIRQNNPKSTLS